MAENSESLRCWLELEDGQEREFEVVGTFEMDGKDYMALLPVAEEENGVVLMGFHGDEEDRIVFDPIEDDEEYERAAEAFEDIFNGKIDQEEYFLSGEEDE